MTCCQMGLMTIVVRVPEIGTLMGWCPAAGVVDLSPAGAKDLGGSPSRLLRGRAVDAGREQADDAGDPATSANTASAVLPR